MFLGISEFDADVFEDKINKITVPEANHLIYHFKDGHTVEMVWKDRSRVKVGHLKSVSKLDKTV